jgi:RNA polymerase sigma-70 factor, ECF subfamily
LENLKTHESNIILAVVSGDTRAFEWIVNKHKDSVAAICFNMLKDKHLADEVGQDTFVNLFKSLKHFRSESSLKTYVSRIAMNLCLNKIKQQKKWWERFAQSEETLLNRPHMEKRIDVELENKELVSMALLALNEKARSLVVLRMMEGYSVKETAEILQTKEGTVMSGLKRAMKKLKTVLIDIGYEEGR